MVGLFLAQHDRRCYRVHQLSDCLSKQARRREKQFLLLPESARDLCRDLQRGPLTSVHLRRLMEQCRSYR
jgi:hypothetical protein